MASLSSAATYRAEHISTYSQGLGAGEPHFEGERYCYDTFGYPGMGCGVGDPKMQPAALCPGTANLSALWTILHLLPHPLKLSPFKGPPGSPGSRYPLLSPS